MCYSDYVKAAVKERQYTINVRASTLVIGVRHLSGYSLTNNISPRARGAGLILGHLTREDVVIATEESVILTTQCTNDLSSQKTSIKSDLLYVAFSKENTVVVDFSENARQEKPWLRQHISPSFNLIR